MTDYKYNMGLRIKMQRKKLNITQDEMSEKLEISVKHLSEVERGIAGLSIENIIKCSNIFGVSIDYLVCGGDDSYCWGKILDSLNEIPMNKQKKIKAFIETLVEIANN